MFIQFPKPMNRYLSIINARTALALAISVTVSFASLAYDFQYNFDLALISIAIIFPLVFTIRSAFRRREKALEFLSLFKAGLITVSNSFQENKKLEDDKKAEIIQQIKNVSHTLIDYLGPHTRTRDEVVTETGKIFAFIQSNSGSMGKGVVLKVLRFMRDVHLGVENVIAINQHRTPIAIRAYCLIFIYIYPIIYTPALIHRLYDGRSFADAWIVYVLSGISTFILISLYNVQEQMENPFDQKGLDDIQLSNYRLE